jgi:hypothetical protein
VREYIDGVRDAAATVAAMNEELSRSSIGASRGGPRAGPLARPEAHDRHRDPPKGQGPLARREARLAWPAAADDPDQRDAGRDPAASGDLLDFGQADHWPTCARPRPWCAKGCAADGRRDGVEYRLRNSSQEEVIENVVLTDTMPRRCRHDRPARGLHAGRRG